MAIFSKYPYLNFSDYNLDWIIRTVKEVNERLNVYVENSVITYADPITWDITKQYTALTVVIDSDGTAYLSEQPVPAGIAITNTDYWVPIFNYAESINDLRSNIGANEESSTTATAARTTGDLVWLGDTLYRVTADMTAGTAYVEGTNCEECTVSEALNDSVNYILGVISSIAAEHYYHVIEGTTASDINTELTDNAGKLIIFKNQTYNLTAPLSIPANSRINLNGAILRRTGGIHNIININANNVRVENGAVDGYCWTDALDNRIAGNRFSNIYAHDCSSLVLTNIYSTGNCSAEYQTEGTNAPILIENVSDAKIIDCESYRDGGSGLLIDQSNNVIVTRYKSEYNAGSGLTGSYNSNITISDSIVRYAGTTYPDYYASNYTGFSLNGEKITCSNCVSEHNSGSGYTLGHNTSHNEITLTGCISSDNTLDGVSVGAERVTIDNCELLDNARACIYCMTEDDRYIIVSNCYLKASGTSAFPVDDKNNAQITNCLIAGKHINVTGVAQISNCNFIEQSGSLASVIISTGGVCYALMNKFSLNGGSCPRCYFAQGTGYSMFDINVDIPTFKQVATGGAFYETALPS